MPWGALRFPLGDDRVEGLSGAVWCAALQGLVDGWLVEMPTNTSSNFTPYQQPECSVPQPPAPAPAPPAPALPAQPNPALPAQAPAAPAVAAQATAVPAVAAQGGWE